ncbi:ABC transporter permease subunit [Mammaliicoccus sp. Dog046]|uniref:ABC transporter permease subunit n=1 Tax=Mammaliicoccus sp. Dog046 TaxID=3034233 RepID=UPI002B2635BE|nr:ABC transporter permease subunit [Mammaliicoccus sp. Dog046]WQK85250.1 ABC transporter permease subunit [Mammaliicoccus sp. Dog046]
MDKNNIKNLMRKELIEVKSDKGTYIPLLIVPILFAVILPLSIFMLGLNNSATQLITGLNAFIENLDTHMFPSDLDKDNVVIYAIFMYFFAPLFLMIPVLFSTIFASSSFIGEKEKKTIEGLLYTPISIKELMMGKILAAAIPSILITWIALLIYGTIVNIYSFKFMGQLIFPNLNWIVLAFLLIPLITFLTISLVIAISHRTKTSKSAQSYSMIIILPIISFVISQSTGLMVFGLQIIFILVVVLIVVNFCLFMFITRTFNTDKFLTKL